MQKVCHMTSAHRRYDQRILYRECVSLFESGYEVTLLVNDTLEEEVFQGVKIKSSGVSYKNNRLKRMIFGVHDIYKMAKNENANIYHFHDPELLFIAKKLKKNKKKVIFDSHEDYYTQILQKEYIPLFIRKFIAKCYKAYESNILKKIDAVVFPAKMDGIDFESRAKRVVYVDNKPRLDELPEEKADLNTLHICYTGGLTYNRGILHIAEAAKEARVKLYLAGPFESEEFKNKVIDCSEYVQYEGILNRQEVYRLYQKCAIGMSVLLKVGQYANMKNLPTKVYEYMAMGMPVILSDTSYNCSLVEKYQFGVAVDPENIKDIVEKIKYLLDNPDVMKKMGNNGYNLVHEKWNWSYEEKKLVALYKELEDECAAM